MKTIGIIGGIGPESTIDYYRRLLAAHRERQPDGSQPAILINSIDLKKMLGLISANQLAEVTDYLVAETSRLYLAGAQVGALASNTPHIVFDEVASRSLVPLVSIVSATCAEAKRLELRKPGLLGTRFTMQSHFYPQEFSRQAIAVALPTPQEQAYIHDKYMNELVQGKFLEETRAGLWRIVARMRRDDGIDGLILGGTELPLILRDGAEAGLHLLDTTKIHVRAILDQAMAERAGG